jgi:nitroreductase
MIKGSDKRQSEHPVDPLFLDRWSPRAMSGEPISEAQLKTLLEAARWAPSAFNGQPWRLLYARRDTPQWTSFLTLLNERNQTWCKDAAALVLFVSKSINDNGQPSVTHSFDTGAAWENLALQGTLENLVVHGMQGFDYERARNELKIPEDYRVEAMGAIGKPGDPSKLPPALAAREVPNGRKPLAEIACEGAFAWT